MKKKDGLLYHYNADSKLYFGQVKNNKYEGQGIEIYPCGVEINGQYYKNQLNKILTFTDLEGNEKEGRRKNFNYIKWLK